MPAGLDRSLLVLVVRGLAIDMVPRLPRTAATLAHASWTRLPPEPTGGLAATLGDGGAMTALRDLGVAVDRRSLLAPGTTDGETLLAAIGRRPTGPAPVTIAMLDELMATARRHGSDGSAWSAALQRCDAVIAALLAALRRGDPPELWLLAGGAPQPVRHTIDIVAALRRQRPPFSGRCRVHGDDGVVHLQAADQHTADRWARQLECLPFARVGLPRRRANGALELLAHPGIAFGRRRLLARAPHAGEERVHLAMPHLPAESPLSWSGLLARVCLRAAAMAPMPLPDATADAPTAEPVGAAGTHDADADYSGLRPPRTSMPERSSTSSM